MKCCVSCIVGAPVHACMGRGPALPHSICRQAYQCIMSGRWQDQLSACMCELKAPVYYDRPENNGAVDSPGGNKSEPSSLYHTHSLSSILQEKADEVLDKGPEPIFHSAQSNRNRRRGARHGQCCHSESAIFRNRSKQHCIQQHPTTCGQRSVPP